MKKTKAIIMATIWITVCIIALSSFSYAWIRREWRPTIHQNNIEIQTGNSLAILMEDGRTLDSISLNEVVNANKSFRLTQVSNLTGWSDDFFRIDVVEQVKDATVFHVDKTDDQSYMQLGADHGYIEVRFMLVGIAADPDDIQYIYISGDRTYTDKEGVVTGTEPGSYIRIPPAVLEDINAMTDEGEKQAMLKKYEDLLGAIRISISIEGISGSDTQTGAKTYCFFGKGGPDKVHTAITNQKVGNSYVANNQPLYNGDSIDPALLGNNNNFVSLDSYFNPVINGVPQDSSKYLFEMAGEETRTMIVRIWLEGQDPGCTEEIAGLDFDLNIQFDSYNPNFVQGQG